MYTAMLATRAFNERDLLVAWLDYRQCNAQIDVGNIDLLLIVVNSIVQLLAPRSSARIPVLLSLWSASHYMPSKTAAINQMSWLIAVLIFAFWSRTDTTSTSGAALWIGLTMRCCLFVVFGQVAQRQEPDIVSSPNQSGSNHD